MRVTSTTGPMTMRAGLADALSRVAEQQEKLASGRRLNRFSDSPADTVSALRYQSQAADWRAWQRSGDDAMRWLTTGDAALQSMSSTLHRVRELATGAVNASLGQNSREAIADEITALRAQLVDLANTKVGDRALFAGFQDTAVTSVDGRWTYAGDSGAVTRQVGPAGTVQVNVSGAQVFGFAAGTGEDVFSVLDRLAAGIRAGDTTAVAAGQDAVARRSSDITRALGGLGALQNKVEAQQTLGLDTINQLEQQRSDLQDVDFADAVLRMQMAQTGYQAALAAAGRASLPSLADFLR